MRAERSTSNERRRHQVRTTRAMTGEPEPALRKVVVTICQNCVDGRPGQCHMPGCLFIRWNIEDTPQPLRWLTEYLEDVIETQGSTT